MTKVLKCKQCGEEVEVPDNRVSAVCHDCGERNLRKVDLEVLIPKLEKQVQSVENNPLVETSSERLRKALRGDFDTSQERNERLKRALRGRLYSAKEELEKLERVSRTDTLTESPEEKV